MQSAPEEFLYLAYLQQHCPATAGTSSAALLDMIRVNVAEGLGADWAQRLQGLEHLQAAGGAMASSAIRSQSSRFSSRSHMENANAAEKISQCVQATLPLAACARMRVPGSATFSSM